MRRLLVLTAAILAAAPAVLAQSGTQPVRASDLFEIRQIGNLAASPDGRRVVYTVTQAYREGAGEKETAGYRTHVWLRDAEGDAAPRALTHGKAVGSGPAWHPSGDTLAFVRAVDGAPQVWLLALSGGEAWPLTAVPGGASNPRFSPDGRQLLVSTGVTEAELRRDGVRLPAWLTTRPGERTRPDTTVRADPDGTPEQQRAWLDRNADRARPRVNTRLSFQSETDVDGTFRSSRLSVVDVRGSEAAPQRGRVVVRTWRDVGGAAWLPSGRALVASTLLDTLVHPDRQTGGRGLVSIDVETGRIAPWLATPGRSAGSPSLSPDGKTLALTTSDDADVGFAQPEIGVVALDGDRPRGDVRLLTLDLDRNVGGIEWGRDSREIYFTAASEGGIPLYAVAVAGGPVRTLTAADEGVSSAAIAQGAGGPVAVVALTTWANPYELWRVDLRTRRAPARLTRHNAWTETRRLSRPVAFEVARPDAPGGRASVQAWAMAPQGVAPGAKVPVLLQIHGGPTAMWGPGEASMWHEFQYAASRGWGVVFSNPRGSGGYGRAFQRANLRDWGTGPTGDVLAALDRVLATEAWADPSRQIVTGGSYAGYLTAWIVGHTDRFKAAAAQRGVYDLPTFFGEGNAWRLVPNYFGGYPWTDSTVAYAGGNASVAEVLRRESPLTYVANIRTPLLIKHGDADRRTGFVQAEMLYRSLAALGRDVEFARYPDATHELSRSGDPILRLDRLLRIHEFLARYVEPR